MDDNDKETKESYLESILVIYQRLPPNSNWHIFWKSFFDLQLPPFEDDQNKFLSTHCELISSALGILGKEHPTSKKFLIDLPLRFSKVIFDWPPTPEQVKELMTD